MPEREIAERLRRPDLTLHTPRVATLDRVEFRAAGDGDASGGTFEGHAAVFNERSEVLYDFWGPFREVLLPGAFADAIAANAAGTEDTKFLGLNHDRNLPLARCSNGTLQLEEDDIGLLCRAALAPTTAAADLRVLLEGGTVDQMSFTFTTTAEGVTWRYDYEHECDLREVSLVARLYDVSPVVYPAYPQTDAGLRALSELGHAAAEVAAGRRSADPQLLARFDQAEQVVERARAALRDKPQPSTDPPSDGGRPASATRARALRLRQLAG